MSRLLNLKRGRLHRRSLPNAWVRSDLRKILSYILRMEYHGSVADTSERTMNLGFTLITGSPASLYSLS